MKNLNKNPHLKIFVFSMSTILYLEILLRATLKIGFFNVGLFYIFLNSLIFSLSISLIASLFKNIGLKIFLAITLSLLVIIFVSQKIYYTIFQTFYTTYSMLNSSQAFLFVDVIFNGIYKNLLVIILMVLPFVALYYLFNNYNKSKIQYALIKYLLTILLIVSLFFSQLLIINTDKNSVAYQNYYSDTIAIKKINSFGLLTYMTQDLISLIIKKPPVIEPPESKPPVEIKPEILYNMLDIDFNNLIKNETNKTLLNMHKYFSGLVPSEKNKMTGLYAGYNVIQLTAEGFSHLAVDKVLTPTLYKLANEGMVFNNFYNPVWNVSTSDGEYVHMTGLIPKNGVWSMKESAKNYMPFVLGNQLYKKGYQTMAYHNHTYNYYDRDLTYPSFNYTYQGLGSGLQVKPTWPESDLEMMQLSINDYINAKAFHTYYMTVSGHMNYTFEGNYIASKNKALTNHLDYTENAKAYLASQIELDLALNYLLTKLNDKGVLDKTLIVMVADHYPYGLAKSDQDNLAGHVIEENFELYKSDLIIWATGMEQITIDEPVYTLDVLPTISNLLDLDFDSRLLSGRDVFSNAKPLVIFNDRSFINQAGFYNANDNTFSNKAISDQELELMIKMVKEKFTYATLILDYNYYQLLID